MQQAWAERAAAFLVWRRSGHVAGRLGLAVAAACFVGLLSQLKLYLPFTPVVFSGQTFGVLLVGGLCGMEIGVIGMSLYLVLGIAGMPWFADAAAGARFACSPTAGYLVGFVAAAALVGYITDRLPAARRFAPAAGIMVSGSALILATGFLGLVVFFGMGARSAFVAGVVPFIPGDVVKSVVAALMLSTAFGRADGPPEG